MGELVSIIIVLVLGISIVLSIVIFSIYATKEKYKDEVIAEIIEYEEYATDAYGKMYVAVLKYKYKGEEYIVKDRHRKFRDPENGYKYRVVTIGVDPKEPRDIQVKASISEISISSRDKWVIGLCLVGIVCILLRNYTQYLTVIILIVVLAFLVIKKCINSPRAKWVEVEAQIIETEKVSTKGGTVLIHVYRYTYEGKEYKVMSNLGSYSGKGRLGSTISIKIDSNNPESIKEELEYKDLTPYAKWTAVILIIFIIVMFVLIKFVW